MSSFKEYIVRIEKGISSSKCAAAELLSVLIRPIDSPEDKIKMAVETKRNSAADYFHILRTIKIQTDNLIVSLEEKNMTAKAREVKDLFEYLIVAYEDGIKAIEDGLEELLLAMEKKIDVKQELTTDKLKSISSAKKIAADDYFYLINFVNKKREEMKTLKLVERPEDNVVEIQQGTEERLAGYAERYAR